MPVPICPCPFHRAPLAKRWFGFLVILTIVGTSAALVSVSPKRPTSAHRRLLASSKMDHDFSLHEMDQARQKLEELIGPILFDDHVDDATGLIQTPHLLTNAGRKRRKLEIQLLKSLEHNDDAIDELMSLWIHECPCKVTSTDSIQFMSSAEATCTLEEAESTLRYIIADCPIELWPEPGARLAFVLYQLGQYTECERYVQAVLQAKPWHFEMLQLQLLLQLTLYGSVRGAIVVARRGLPALTAQRKRSIWVQNAVRQAKQKLRRLEEYTTSAHGQTDESLASAQTKTVVNANIPNEAAAAAVSTSSIWQ